MDIVDRYNELDNIISSLNLLIDELQSKSEIEFFKNLVKDYQDEQDELEIELQKETEEEIKERQKEYWESQF